MNCGSAARRAGDPRGAKQQMGEESKKTGRKALQVHDSQKRAIPSGGKDQRVSMGEAAKREEWGGQGTTKDRRYMWAMMTSGVMTRVETPKDRSQGSSLPTPSLGTSQPHGALYSPVLGPRHQ